MKKINLKINFLLLLMFLFGLTNSNAQKTLQPQNASSKVNFSINNFGLSTEGTLTNLTGKIMINAKKIEASMADVSISVATINTDNERRDKHLKNADFFDVEKYPTMRMVSTKITKNPKGAGYIFTGKLTIKNITRAISFPFIIAQNQQGYLFSGSFKINRLHFGVGDTSATLGDVVTVSLSIFAQ